MPELSIFGSPSTCGLGWQKRKICIVNNRASLAEASALFTGSWIANHCERVISTDLHNSTPRSAFLRRSGAKRQRRPCIYYFNTTATFRPLLLGDLMFKLNPLPAHTLSRLNGLKQNTQRSRSTRNTENLITPDRVRLYPSDQQLTLCTLNARSLNNKSAAFVDLVCDVRADLFTICETWFKDHHSAVLSELTPPGYRMLVHCPRPGRRGGGTALLVKEGINVSNVYSDEKTSFEVSEWLVSFGSTRVRIVIVYRPPYSEDHPITAGVFFHEFAEYLEFVVMSSDKLLITGDFNFHMDVPTDPNNIHFRDLLDVMGLVQHVKQPTHIHGHTLDPIIMRQSDDFIAEELLFEKFISDHAALICSLMTRRPVVELKHAEYRKLKSIDSVLFAEDIRNSILYIDPPDDLEKLFNCYNRTLSSLLKKHAPIQSRKIRNRPRPPWFDDEIMQARRDRLKAEKRWRRTGLASDLLAFKSKRNYVIYVMNKARRTYYSQFIEENSSNQSKLSRESKRLLNIQADKTLPPQTNAVKLANDMGDYFVHKITAIRSKLAASTQSLPSAAQESDYTTTLEMTDLSFSEFALFTEEDVKNLSLACKKSCDLDPLPSSILFIHLDHLLPVFTKMINLSLKTGRFADDKKSGLELVNKNFRPTCNLQFISKLIEKAVAIQLKTHMLTSGLFPEMQSAYRDHSTETALLKVKNDILMNMDMGHVKLLDLLDLSAAFYTVDHDILIHDSRCSAYVGQLFNGFDPI